MISYKTIAKMLKFKGLKITGLFFQHGNQLTFVVKPFKNGCRCPECGHRGKIIRTREHYRCWRDVPCGGWRVWLTYAPREICCPTHGRVTEQIPWADAHSQVSYRYEYAMLHHCQTMTQKAAAELLQVPTSTLSDQLHRCITRIRAGHRIRGLKRVGIDEIAYRKNHQYATLVYDLERSVVVWVGKGKGRETIDEFFENQLSDYQKQQIETACCDMSESYMGAITEHCPNATLVLDRFHIVKKLNEAVDEVRKEQWRESDAETRKSLKGLRWLLYRHSSTRKKSDTRTLNALEKGNRRIYRAWRLKDEFERFWEYQASWAAKRFLRRWTTTVMRSRIEPMKKFVATVRKHQDKIVAFIDTGGLTNAVSEGINRIVKIIKNRASGFRSLKPFEDLILLNVGDVDIPAQVPAKFRTV